MPRRLTDYRKTLRESLADPSEAALYLEAALEDSDEMFLVALRDVAESRRMLVEQAGVSQEVLSRIPRDPGNPTLKSLASILEAVGLRLSVTAVDENGRDRSRDAYPQENLALSDIRIEWTSFDVRIRFGQLLFVGDPPEAEMIVKERAAVTLAWADAKSLRDTLTDLITKYENVNGEIKAPVLPLA